MDRGTERATRGLESKGLLSDIRIKGLFCREKAEVKHGNSLQIHKRFLLQGGRK